MIISEERVVVSSASSLYVGYTGIRGMFEGKKMGKAGDI